MNYKKPNLLLYRLAQIICGLVAFVIFRPKVLRNELKGKHGPFVVLGNHQAALDFISLITRVKEPMTFVISNSFYSTLPVKGYLDKLGVIPKQQFQTAVNDMKKMKAVIKAGHPLAIYPAGLMCEDGLSTPIPTATYKFIKWLDADVYVAKVSGTYFAMPKWAKGIRPGRTCIDIYKLFSREELASLNLEEVRQRTDCELLYDAYREQEHLLSRHKNGSNVEGLENVLYLCPHCGKEFSIEVRNGSTLLCTHCGYEQESDEYGFLHNKKGLGPEIRYVSDWSKLTYETLKKNVLQGQFQEFSCPTRIRMVNHHKHKFVDVGGGTLTLTPTAFRIEGIIDGNPIDLAVPIAGIPTLPFSPGKHLEVQDGKDIYRCVLSDGKLVLKFIHLVKIFYELSHSSSGKVA